MRRHPRRDVRVDDCGREAFVFAILGEDPMRDRERAAKRRERARDRLFGSWIGVRMEQADGECVGAAARCEPANSCELIAANRLDGAAVEQRALIDAEAHRATDERLRTRRRERVQVVAILAADFDQVFEAGVGEHCDPRAFLFEQRVGRDGGTVSDTVRRRIVEHLAQAADDGVRWVGRGREHFVHADFASDDRDEIGEGAAGVDSDQYRAAIFHGFTLLSTIF